MFVFNTPRSIFFGFCLFVKVTFRFIKPFHISFRDICLVNLVLSLNVWLFRLEFYSWNLKIFYFSVFNYVKLNLALKRYFIELHFLIQYLIILLLSH